MSSPKMTRMFGLRPATGAAGCRCACACETSPAAARPVSREGRRSRQKHAGADLTRHETASSRRCQAR